MSVLHIEDVSYSIGDNVILDEIRTVIPSNSLTGLIGPNGAGKSTLLRLLNGLRKPSRGRVLLNGREVHNIPDRERARIMTMMPQNSGVGFGFTVGEVVAMGRHPFVGRFSPLTERCQAIITQSLRATHVEQFVGRRITQLSGGERQRVFLARALAQEPQVLLLDEPTANLDVRHQLEVFELVSHLQSERQMTVIMAVHDLMWALRYCSYLIVLHEGRLVAAGPTRDVVNEQLLQSVFGVRTTLDLNAEPIRLLDISL